MQEHILLREFLHRAERFKREAHRILSIHESADSRVVILDQTYRKLSTLSVNQDDLIRQALRCMESQLFRAAHVMAWAATMDFIEEKITLLGLKKLQKIRPNWKTSSIEELREYHPESQIIDAARDLGICTKNMAKALHGLLNKRNECAHPSNYFPDLNQTLGYISEVISRIEMLK